MMPRNTVMIVDEPPAGDDNKETNNAETPSTNLAIEYDVEAADPESTHALKLTVKSSDEGNETRTVPGACAICLCPYELGDKVTWSPKEACQHAFHSECIIPWLAKSDEPKCPCCRQDFCEPVPISQLEVDPISIFGTPMALDGDDDNVLPHFMRTLEASRLEFLAKCFNSFIQACRWALGCRFCICRMVSG